jgi:hypothetical protein
MRRERDKDEEGELEIERPQPASLAALLVELGEDEEAVPNKIWSHPPPCFASSPPLAAWSLTGKQQGSGRRPPVLLPTG